MSINLVLCGDRRILWGLAVTVRSALEHSSKPVNIHVLCAGFSKADKQKLSASWDHDKCGAIDFKDIATERISRFRSTRYMRSKSTYSRFFIGEFYPDLLRSIYVDTDFLICRDLAPVSELDLRGRIAAVVRDISVREQPVCPELKARLNLTNEMNYFNGGFLVIDLQQWREAGIQEKLVTISIEKFDQLHSQDQDALNIVLENKVLFLDPTWNTSQYERPDSLKGNMVHLIGKIKPWHARYKKKLSDRYFREVIYRAFYDFLDRTAYKGSRPWDPAGLGTLVEHAGANIPTLDMVQGKIRRVMEQVRDHR